MPGQNHRTWQNYHVGHFMVTVELDPAAEAVNIERHRELADVTRRLVSLFDTHRIPATFAASDPAHSAATPIIIRSHENHEMAILGDANWIGPTAGRTRFARELVRRVTQARAAGLDVTSLVPRVASVDKHIDLVVKQNITVVTATADAQKTRPAVPRALHYGVWELPVCGTLPTAVRWFSTPGWSTWREIRRAASDATMFHLIVDVPAVTQHVAASERTLAWFVRRVATLRDRGMVKIETLRTTASRLSAVPTVSPQSSILRRVA